MDATTGGYQSGPHVWGVGGVRGAVPARRPYRDRHGPHNSVESVETKRVKFDKTALSVI